MRRWLLGMMTIAVVVGSLSSLPLSAASAFADQRFQQRWQQDEAITSNFWGPLATASDRQNEPYGDPRATGGNRLVQYFDKGRMEIGNDGVTSGLLATELITGRIQTGDTTFELKAPPAIPIAGDADNPGPTYAQLASQASTLLTGSPRQLASTPPLPVVSSTGTVSAGTDAPPTYAVSGLYDFETHHSIPRAFVAYREKAGLASIGLAISDAFMMIVKVGGQQRQVMVQIFERRVLTYTDSNPDAFKVEMGNIGQHYYQWRYSSGTSGAAASPTATSRSSTSSASLPFLGEEGRG